MITISNVSKKIGSRVLFDDVNASFNPGNRYGLTGPNGAGKSTLLKIMMGQIDPTSGTISLPKKVGFLKQDLHAFEDFKLIDTVIMGNERLWKAMEERESLYEQEMTDEVGMRLGELEEIVAEENGYTAEPEAEMLLEGMGIPHSHFHTLMKENPTDWQFKVLLCQAIFGNPEALLLDEPTNHLDMDSISWLEQFLLRYEGTLLVVSHDRHFLNTVTTHIADIDYDTIIIYPGNYDTMVETKKAARERELQDIKNKEKKVAQLKDFVSKFSAGTRASQVQSRLREIRKLEPQDPKKTNIQRPYIRFQTPEKDSGQTALHTKGLCKSYDGVDVLNKVNLEIMRGSKIGVIGNNGRGKTTLLKLLAGQIKPDKGQVVFGHNLSLGYFPQNHEEAIDKSQATKLFDWLKSRKPDAYDQEVRGVLGKLLFPGDDAFKEINKLSGGETARAILASLMLVNENTLILDEPNNHLDLEAVSALAWGLNDFKGTAIVASHDRDLLDQFADQIIALEEDGVHFFDGGLEEYLKVRKKDG